MKLRKIGIIGTGHVGAHVALSLATQGICDEMVLVDIDDKKAISEVQDLEDSCSYLPHRFSVKKGNYEDVADCDIVVVSVGVLLQSGDRLAELQVSVDMVDSFIPKVVEAGFKGIFIVITNPCDIITHRVWKLSGFPKNRVFGSGTTLDSSRLRRILSKKSGIDHKSITAYSMGEHGDSQMIPWSHVCFGGVNLKELERTQPDVFAGWDKDALLEELRLASRVIINGKGATEFGIGASLSKLVNAVFHDEKAVYPVSTLLDGLYGQGEIFASTPCIIGKNGVEAVFELELPEDEKKAYEHTCNVIAENIRKIK